MRVKIFVVLESVFLGLGMLILSPSANPKAAGKASNPSLLAPAPLPTSNANSNATPQAKPLAVWECTTSWYSIYNHKSNYTTNKKNRRNYKPPGHPERW